jgi:hypothetical protein
MTVDDEAVEEAQTITNALLTTVHTQPNEGDVAKGRKPDTPEQKLLKLIRNVDVAFVGTAQVVDFAGTPLIRQSIEDEAKWDIEEVYIQCKTCGGVWGRADQ